MALCSGADSAYLHDLLVAHGRGDEYARRESAASALAPRSAARSRSPAAALLAEIDLALPYVATAVVAAVAAWPRVARCTRTGRAAPARRRTSSVGADRHWLRSREVARNGRLAWIVGYSAVVFALARARRSTSTSRTSSERGLGAVRDRPAVRGRLRGRARSSRSARTALRRGSATTCCCGGCSRSARGQLRRARRRGARPVDARAARRPGDRERRVLAADQAAAQPRDRATRRGARRCCRSRAWRGAPRWACSRRSPGCTARRDVMLAVRRPSASPALIVARA